MTEDVKPSAKQVMAVTKANEAVAPVTSDGNFLATNAAAVNFMAVLNITEAGVDDVKPSAKPITDAKPRASNYYHVLSVFSGAALAATVTTSVNDCYVNVALESYKAHQVKYAMATKHSLWHDQKRKKFELSLIESLLGPQKNLLSDELSSLSGALVPKVIHYLGRTPNLRKRMLASDVLFK